MRPSTARFVPAILLLALTLAGTPVRAVTPVVDGVLDPAYGPALATQTNGTAYKDTMRVAGGSNGMELDQGYGIVSNGVLYLMLTGNMLLLPNPVDPGTEYTPFDLFIDCVPGGQNTLRADNDTLGTQYLAYHMLMQLSGLTFDTDFTPDFWLGCSGGGGPDLIDPYHLLTFSAPLASGAGASVTFLGWADVPGAHELVYGSNPYGIALALDNSNAAGVSQGCGAASGAGVTTGLELAIPLAALGDPTGPIKVCAFYMGQGVSNQVLGPVPPGTCSFGAPGGVSFATIAGSQYFVVDPTASVPPPVAPAGLRLAPSTNPGAGLTVSCTLVGAAEARIDVIDSGGRRVRTRTFSPAGAGPATIAIARPSELAPGVYFLRLTQGPASASARAVVTR